MLTRLDNVRASLELSDKMAGVPERLRNAERQVTRLRKQLADRAFTGVETEAVVRHDLQTWVTQLNILKRLSQ